MNSIQHVNVISDSLSTCDTNPACIPHTNIFELYKWIVEGGPRQMVIKLKQSMMDGMKLTFWEIPLIMLKKNVTRSYLVLNLVYHAFYTLRL